ncbi:MULTISPECIES: hypothetical protein [unclassified Methanoregula]|uniref:hypothetical protein n=1 Tax=unclassified Methanoregula TaxID=2649730 RepID=UPI0025E1A3C4|nr:MULTISPECIES: hypothetical protein [unclassified Methanoregula]
MVVLFTGYRNAVHLPLVAALWIFAAIVTVFVPVNEAGVRKRNMIRPAPLTSVAGGPTRPYGSPGPAANQ